MLLLALLLFVLDIIAGQTRNLSLYRPIQYVDGKASVCLILSSFISFYKSPSLKIIQTFTVT